MHNIFMLSITRQHLFNIVFSVYAVWREHNSEQTIYNQEPHCVIYGKAVYHSARNICFVTPTLSVRLVIVCARQFYAFSAI